MVVFDTFPSRIRTFVLGFFYSVLWFIVFRLIGFVHFPEEGASASIVALLVVSFVIWVAVYFVGLGLYVMMSNGTRGDAYMPLLVVLFVVFGGWVFLLLGSMFLPFGLNPVLSSDIAIQMVMGFILALSVFFVESFKVLVLTIVFMFSD